MRLVIVLALLPLTAHAQDTRAPDTRAPDTGHGYQLFTSIGCSACHGSVGQGSRTAGPRLAPHTPPMAAFLTALRHPVNEMPPYTETVLPDADAADIRAYLATIATPSLNAKDVPALN